MAKVGRPKLIERRQVLEELQKLLPRALKTIDNALDNKNKNPTTDAWKIVDRFVPELKATEISGTDSGPLKIELVREVIKEADGNDQTSSFEL